MWLAAQLWVGTCFILHGLPADAAAGTALAVAVGFVRGRLPVRSEREPVAPAGQHPQVVVVGVVLHHQDHDVLDLGEAVGTGLLVRTRPMGQVGSVTPEPLPGPRDLQTHQHALILPRPGRVSKSMP